MNNSLRFFPIVAVAILGAVVWAELRRPPEQETAREQSPKEALHVISAPQPATPPGYAGSYLAARYAGFVQDDASAARFYDYALENRQHDVGVLRQAMRAHLIAGDVERAARIAMDLQEEGEESQLSHLLMLAYALRHEQLEVARREMEQLAPYGFISMVQPLLGGWISSGGEEVAELGPENRGLLKIDIFRQFFAYQKALMYDLRGDRRKAEKYYKMATDDLGSVPYNILLARMDFYRRSGQMEQAEQLLEAYHASNPSSMLARGADADVVFRDLPDGKRVVSSAAEGVGELFYAISGLLFKEEFSTETLIYLRLALYLNPEHGGGLLMLGNYLEEQNKPQQAMAAYASVGGRGPLYRRAQIRLAFVEDEQGSNRKALSRLESLARQYPRSPDIYVMQGDIFRKSARYPKATEAYSNALLLYGEVRQEYQWPIYFARGISFEHSGDWDRAEQDFKAALALYPGQPDVLNYLGYSWLTQGVRLEEAREMLEKAVAERPEDGHIIDSMGWALYKLGEYDESVAYLEQAVDLMPSDPTVNDHLGDAYWQIGRRNEARFQWERALVYKPDEKDRPAIVQKIQAGLPTDSDAPSPEASVTQQLISVSE